MANGETVEPINPVSVTVALKSLDEDNDFAILSKGDSFVQAAVGDEGYVVEYKDDSWKEITEWETAE